MIAVDASALMAILRKELLGEACEAVLRTDEPLLMSAATLTECLVVAARKRTGPGMAVLIEHLRLSIVDVTPEFARRAAAAYDRWGKGVHPAALNYGDSFSYALAELYDCPLLYIGDDFAQTDVRSALSA